MPSKTANVTNADTKPKKPKGFQKGNSVGKQFTGADDPRRNNNGQRSREVVATQAQARALYVQVLHEPINAEIDPQMSNLELIVRQHVKAAKQGNADAREKMFDRIWGKANQPVDLTGNLKHEHSGTISYDEARELPPDELARRYRSEIGALAETKRRW